MRLGEAAAARLVALTDASDAAAQNNLGVVLHAAGHAADAQSAFRRAIALDSGMTLARANLRALPAEVSAAAIASSWAAVRMDPTDADGWRAVVRHHSARGEFELAAAALSRWDAVHGQPALAPTVERARIALDAGRPTATLAAIAHARALIAEHPGTADAISLAASIDLLEASAAYRCGDSARALAAVERARAAAPDDPEVELLRSFVLGELGDSTAAVASRERAAALDPTLHRVDAGLALAADASVGHSTGPEVADAPRVATFHTVVVEGGRAEQVLATATALRHRAYYEDALRALAPLLESPDEAERASALAAIGAVHLQRGAPADAVAALSDALVAAPAGSALAAESGLALAAARLLTGDLAGSDAAARIVAQGTGASALVRAGAISTRALVAWRTGDAARARAGLLDAAVQARSLDATVRSAIAANLALLLSETGATNAALSAGSAAVRLAPADVAAHVAYASVASHAGQHAAARDAYARACAIDAHDAAARYGLAFAAGACGDRASARRELARATALSPVVRGPSPRVIVDADGPLRLALDGTPTRAPTGAVASTEPPVAEYAHVDARLAFGEYERALAAADAALARGASAAGGLLRAGHALARGGHVGAALDRYVRAALAAPEDPGPESHVVRTLYQLGHLNDACARARDGIDRWPSVPAFASLLARAAADRGAVDLATEALERCARFHRGAESVPGTASDAAAFWADVACAWQAVGGWREAADAWAEAACAVPTISAPLLARARALARAGDAESADAVLDRVAAASPDLPDVWRARAEIAMAAGELGAACGHLVRVVEQDVHDVDALASLAAACADSARVDEARAAANRALAREPEHPLALAVAGDCAAADDPGAARDFWRRALAVSPVGAGAARARRGLRAAVAASAVENRAAA